MAKIWEKQNWRIKLQSSKNNDWTELKNRENLLYEHEFSVVMSVFRGTTKRPLELKKCCQSHLFKKRRNNSSKNFNHVNCIGKAYNVFTKVTTLSKDSSVQWGQFSNSSNPRYNCATLNGCFFEGESTGAKVGSWSVIDRSYKSPTRSHPMQ